MEKQRTIYVTVRIDYKYNDSHFNFDNVEDTDETAINSALQPNYGTICDGVQLENVECCGIND